jgi:hypothetical protein
VAYNNGIPPSNPAVILPTPDEILSDKVLSGIFATSTTPKAHPFVQDPASSLALSTLIGVALGVIILYCLAFR